MDMHWYSTDWPFEAAVFYLDPYWTRIVYTKYGSSDIKAFNLESYPGAEYPSEPWGITTDDWGNIYVSDKRNDCIIKLVYVPSSNSIYYSSKLMIPGLDGPTDVVYSSHNTPNNSTDDYFLIANKNARNIIKTDISGNVLNTITRFKTEGSYYDFISPIRITQVPNSTYIAVLDEILKYVVVGYIGEANTLYCHNVINFGCCLNPTDVGTNCYGDILVPDENNQIHKFNIIGDYLCTYKSNAFHFPLRFSRVNDLEYLIFDQNCADRWSPDHGIKRFIPGSDAFKLAYNQSSTEHQFFYTLSDYSKVKLQIINSNNQVILTKDYGDRISGRRTEIISMSEIPPGDYTYRINYKPLHDEDYGAYEQGWKYTQIPISVSLRATITGPTNPPNYSNSTFQAVTNAQYVSYQWEQMLVCCTDDYNCGIFFYKGSNSTLNIYNTNIHYYLRLTVWDGVGRSAVDYHYVSLETCVQGGGGNGCPTLSFELDSISDSDGGDENPLLISSTTFPTEDVVDYYLIQSDIAPIKGDVHFTIREPETEHTWLDQVQLIEVETNQDELVAVTDNGEIVNYLESDSTLTIMLNDTIDVTTVLALRDGDALNILPGDILSININENSPDADDNVVAIDGFVAQKNITADVLFIFPGGGDEDVGDFFLRPNASISALNFGGLGAGTLKLVFYQNATIDFLSLINDLNTADIETLEMTAAEHSESGSVLELVNGDPDQQYAEIYPNQDISFTFTEGEHSLPKIQYVLKTIGRYETDTTDALNKLNSVKKQIIPIEFALDQNYPNPFNPVTTIDYDLPGFGSVKLKIYDMLGREVRTLVNTRQEAGRYKVNFDATSLASGIYLYRLEVNDPSTGLEQGFISVKKMILLK
jgi:hypothetical protein